MSAKDETRQNGSAASDGTRRPLRDGIDTARAQVEDVAQTARERALDAYDDARDRARTAGRTIEDNPIATLVGGIALGVVVGLLLPRTERETELLGSLGQRIQDGAREAAGAAREAGQEKFAELGLNRDHVGETARGLIDGVIAAAASAGAAAFDAARKSSGA